MKFFKRKNPIRKSGFRKPGKHNVKKKEQARKAREQNMERARAAGAEVGKKAGQAAYGEYQKEKEAARQDAKEEFRRADLEIVTPIGVIKKKGEEGQGTERGAGGPSGSPGVSEKKPKASGMPEIPGM